MTEYHENNPHPNSVMGRDEAKRVALLEAAPKLLRALKMLVGNPDYAQHMTVGDMDIALATIAKAEGRK